MRVHPMLISLAREYIGMIHAISHGRFTSSRALHDMEGQRAVLHQQFLAVVNAADYEQAEQDAYAYAVKVIEWARLH